MTGSPFLGESGIPADALELFPNERAKPADIGDRGAQFSQCGRYRYRLWRIWDADTPPALFVMLNPSTADAEQDDPTIRRCIGFAKRWGLGGVRVVNLYAWRATKPADLPEGKEAIGEWVELLSINDEVIREEAARARRIVAAWGAWPGPRKTRPDEVRIRLRTYEHEVWALALTKRGHPRHPLYVKGDVDPVRYRREYVRYPRGYAA